MAFGNRSRSAIAAAAMGSTGADAQTLISSVVVAPSIICEANTLSSNRTALSGPVYTGPSGETERADAKTGRQNGTYLVPMALGFNSAGPSVAVRQRDPLQDHYVNIGFGRRKP